MRNEQMDRATHAMADAGSPDVPLTAAALRDSELGLVAVADAAWGASPRQPRAEAAAAQMALDLFRTALQHHEELLGPTPQIAADLWKARMEAAVRQAVDRAAQEIYALGRRQKRVMRVTFDAAVCTGHGVVIAHMGDGRIYLSRQGLIHQLTRDHLRAHDRPFDHDDEQDTPLCFLGPKPHAEPETMFLEVCAGDRLVLLSTGFCAKVEPDRLQEIAEGREPEGVTPALVSEARDAGTTGPIAAGLLTLEDPDASRSDRSPGHLTTLARMPLFQWCNEAELRAVARSCRPIVLAAGNQLFREGDLGDAFYLVVSGEVQVLKNTQSIAALGPGNTIGEMAMFDQPRRSATVRVAEDARLLVITRERFFHLLQLHPQLAVKILWNMTLRISGHLRTTQALFAQQPHGNEASVRPHALGDGTPS